jgi:hypothetical protein
MYFVPLTLSHSLCLPLSVSVFLCLSLSFSVSLCRSLSLVSHVWMKLEKALCTLMPFKSKKFTTKKTDPRKKNVKKFLSHLFTFFLIHIVFATCVIDKIKIDFLSFLASIPCNRKSWAPRVYIHIPMYLSRLGTLPTYVCTYFVFWLSDFIIPWLDQMKQPGWPDWANFRQLRCVCLCEKFMKIT